MTHAKPKLTETHILHQIRDYLRLKRWFVVRIQQGLGCHKGVTDLIAVKHGQTLWVEVKTPTGRLSEHQERFRDDITAHGGLYIVARCMEDVMRAADG